MSLQAQSKELEYLQTECIRRRSETDEYVECLFCFDPDGNPRVYCAYDVRIYPGRKTLRFNSAMVKGHLISTSCTPEGRVAYLNSQHLLVERDNDALFGSRQRLNAAGDVDFELDPNTGLDDFYGQADQVMSSENNENNEAPLPKVAKKELVPIVCPCGHEIPGIDVQGKRFRSHALQCEVFVGWQNNFLSLIIPSEGRSMKGVKKVAWNNDRTYLFNSEAVLYVHMKKDSTKVTWPEFLIKRGITYYGSTLTARFNERIKEHQKIGNINNEYMHPILQGSVKEIHFLEALCQMAVKLNVPVKNCPIEIKHLFGCSKDAVDTGYYTIIKTLRNFYDRIEKSCLSNGTLHSNRQKLVREMENDVKFYEELVEKIEDVNL